MGEIPNFCEPAQFVEVLLPYLRTFQRFTEPATGSEWHVRFLLRLYAPASARLGCSEDLDAERRGKERSER
jgi:hypothetical protein